MRLKHCLARCYWRWRLRKDPLPRGFRPDWYLSRYPDVAASGVSAGEHYRRFGRREQRDPNPDFSTSGYRLTTPSARQAPDALRHHERSGQSRADAGRPVLAGQQPHNQGGMTVMVCAHQAGKTLFGAERSLLDVLQQLSGLGVNLLVTLPEATNPGYIEHIRALSGRVAVLPYGWWRASRAAVPETLGHFQALMDRFDVDAVYANTLVLREPLEAARRRGTPVAVHVRELLAHDAALCERLEAGADTLAGWLRENADLVVANSRYTADTLGLPDALVVPNAVDGSSLAAVATPARRGEAPTVGMISSNLPKKGLDDFVALARMLKSAAPGARCCLVGPENDVIERLRAQMAAGEAPDNLEIAGYADSPAQALGHMDVVVNLSHFQESFGRTVLEAMAASRPVVAYRWGALPELVEDGRTGYLVERGDVATAAHKVTALLADADLRATMGQLGRQRAETHYGPEAMRRALVAMLKQLDNGRDRRR